MSPKRPSASPPSKRPSKPEFDGASDDAEEEEMELAEGAELELDDEEDEETLEPEEEEDEVEAPRVLPRPSPPRPWGGSRSALSPEELGPDELTPEMRWPPGSWVRVTDVVRHSTGEPIEGLEVGDVGQVIAALSQTLVVLFPSRDNRREVIHIDSIQAVEGRAARSRT